jgi:hypothetical protein
VKNESVQFVETGVDPKAQLRAGMLRIDNANPKSS